MCRPRGPQGDLVEILPEVLCHQTEGTEVGEAEGVKAGVSVVRVWPLSLQAGGSLRAHAGARRVSAHDELIGVRIHIPRRLVRHPVLPVLVGEVPPHGEQFRVVQRVVPYAHLGQHADVDLQSEEGKDGERKCGEDDHVTEVLDGVDNGRDDGFKAGDHSDGLERPEDAERAEGGEATEVDGDGDVRHEDHQEVQPIPRVAKVGEAVYEEAAGDQLHG